MSSSRIQLQETRSRPCRLSSLSIFSSEFCQLIFRVLISCLLVGLITNIFLIPPVLSADPKWKTHPDFINHLFEGVGYISHRHPEQGQHVIINATRVMIMGFDKFNESAQTFTITLFIELRWREG